MEAIENIERYASQGHERFDKDELIQVWEIHHIQIIGEAAASLSEQIREKYQTVPWSRIVGMRNILVHEYFGVDLETVWGTVKRDLPTFKIQVCAIIEREKSLEHPPNPEAS